MWDSEPACCCISVVSDQSNSCLTHKAHVMLERKAQHSGNPTSKDLAAVGKSLNGKKEVQMCEVSVTDMSVGGSVGTPHQECSSLDSTLMFAFSPDFPSSVLHCPIEAKMPSGEG